MFKNREEKNLKRWFKRKISITVSTMITFLISGQISYTYGVAQGLDSRDSIAITG